MKRQNLRGTTDLDDSKIIERTDGYYLHDKRTGEEFGPYASFQDAVASRENVISAELEPCVDLKEAEEELGIADWIDPETGSLAEESVPHLEDH